LEIDAERITQIALEEHKLWYEVSPPDCASGLRNRQNAGAIKTSLSSHLCEWLEFKILVKLSLHNAISDCSPSMIRILHS